ncbi:MAG TPA: PspC domain-containing protein [Parafilimonas sp.]|nr:PspC domain-containing protein [Parafilimonas sp.]
MKKVININFQGRVIPIEETAYEILKQYIESLRQFFAKEEGKEEIINDIEGRIGELFSEVLKKGAACITDADVHTIMNSIGRPEDFEAEEAGAPHTESARPNQSYERTQYAPRGRLYRDENDKLLGGVCAGIANYFRLDPSLVRILFAIVTFGGFGTGFLIYILLWILLPSRSLETQLRKRLFRNPDDRVVAGVASGIAAYFNISVWIPRLIFALPLVLGVVSSIFQNAFFHFNPFPSVLFGSFGGSLFIIYIVLWAVIPLAHSATEKLEMRGEKVDLNTIKTTIQEDLSNLKTRAEKWGSEVKENFQERGRTLSSEVGPAAKRSGSRLWNAIGIIFKGFFLLVFGCIAFALLMGMIILVMIMIGFMAGGISAFPLKGFIISGFWQNFLAWSTLLLFLGVPVIAFLTWIIRRLIRTKSRNHYIGYTFAGLWTLGLIAAICLAASISSDYKTKAGIEEKIELAQPTTGKLFVKALPRNNVRYFESDWYGIHWDDDGSPFYALTEDSLVLRTVQVRIQKSDDSAFHINEIKFSRGANPESAKDAASKILFPVNQTDSIINLPRGFNVSRQEKFRNQQVLIIIDVPVGKRIELDRIIDEYSGFNLELGNGYNDWDWNDDWRNNFDWRPNVEYIMTSDGLKPTHPEESKADNDVQEDEPATDSTHPAAPSQQDSSRYHYQPSKDSQSTTTTTKIRTEVAPAIQSSFKISDVTSTLLERFSL